IGWYVMNVNIGVLWYFAVTSVGVYGIFLAGYASNSKYSMLGALRSSAQMISYEMALGLSLVPVFILAGSVRMVDIVNAQHTWWFLGKVVALLCSSVWLRATLPRMRYDRLMALSWKSLFPLSLAMMMVTAVVVVAAQGTL